MNHNQTPTASPSSTRSPLRDDVDVLLPAAEYLQYQNRADGWSAGRQSAFLSHLADNGVVADAARAVGMSVSGGYALRRTARGYAFDLGWEAALLIARRVVADNLMAAAIKGETARWVREDGVTTYTRQNTRLSLTLLDRVNPTSALPEVLAVVSRFNWFLQLIEDGVSAEDLWSLFFDETLPRTDYEARERVRGRLLLCEDSADSDEDVGTYVRKMEFKSMEGPSLEAVEMPAHEDTHEDIGAQRYKSMVEHRHGKKHCEKRSDSTNPLPRSIAEPDFDFDRQGHSHDTPLFPPRHGCHLGTRKPVQNLV
jgi:hypothetical protein